MRRNAISTLVSNGYSIIFISVITKISQAENWRTAHIVRNVRCVIIVAVLCAAQAAARVWG